MAAAGDDEGCPICFEPLPAKIFSAPKFAPRSEVLPWPPWPVAEGWPTHGGHPDCIRMLCCGKELCLPCSVKDRTVQKESYEAKIALLVAQDTAASLAEAQAVPVAYRCPICRTDIPETVGKEFHLLKWRVSEHDDWGWAHMLLGMYYDGGFGCEADRTAAFYHFSRAAALDVGPEAHTSVGDCFCYGLGVRESHVDAARFYEAAAAQDYPPGQYAFGKMLMRKGADKPRAVHNFRAAAEHGLDEAQIVLASLFRNSDGIGKSLEMSLHWSRRAAEQGHMRGMGYVGQDLIHIAEAKYGNGINALYGSVGDCVLPEALFWLRKALSEEPVFERCRLDSRERETWAPYVEMCESFLSRQCWNCGQDDAAALSRCSRCKCAFYCSGKSCQLNHWMKGHQWDCCDKDGVKKMKPKAGVVPPKIEAEADDTDGAIRRPTPRRAATFWETNVFLPFCAPILLRLRAVELFKRYCVEPAPDQSPTFWDACVIMFFCEPMLLCLRAVGLVKRYCVDPAPEQAPTFWEKCFLRTFGPPILLGLRVAEQVKQFL